MLEKKHILSRATKKVQALLPPSEYRVWFSRLSLKEVNGDSVVLSVPNRFHASWIREKYLSLLEKSLSRVLKHPTTVDFYLEQASLRRPPSEKATGDGLDPEMTFESFYAGEWNRFALSSALEVVDKKKSSCNPLYVYSAPGLGKTHLLHAMGNRLCLEVPPRSVRYVSSTTFASDFTRSWRNDQLQSFHSRYSSFDALLFDNVHLLSRRTKIQQALVTIFDALYSQDKTIVVTANRTPQGLATLNEHLRSRLAWGVLAEIVPPDQNHLLDITRRKIEEQQLSIPEDVLFFVSQASSDIRSLLKNIGKLQTYVSMKKGDINLSTAKSLIKDPFKKKKMGIEEIKSVTAGYFNISIQDLISGTKKRSLTYPRQVAMYLARRYTDLSFQEIGESFGNKNHSTVIYAIRRIEKQTKARGSMTEDLSRIERLLA